MISRTESDKKCVAPLDPVPMVPVGIYKRSSTFKSTIVVVLVKKSFESER